MEIYNPFTIFYLSLKLFSQIREIVIKFRQGAIMQNAQTIYQQNIVRLPNSEKLRLATLILQDLSETSGDGKETSALDLLENLPQGKLFNSSREVDEYLKTERESWDN